VIDENGCSQIRGYIRLRIVIEAIAWCLGVVVGDDGQTTLKILDTNVVGEIRSFAVSGMRIRYGNPTTLHRSNLAEPCSLEGVQDD
jgi:hypothetical protein